MSAAFDGADVDVECVAYRDGALYYRSRRDPRALRRSDAREAALARACVLARAVDDMVSETTRALVCGESTREAARSSANARSEPR